MYRDESKKQRRNLLLATLVVLLLLGVDWISGGGIIRKPAQRFVVSLSSNVAAFFTHIGSSGFFTTKAGLERENQDLRAQLAAMQDKMVAVQAILTTNKELAAASHLAAIQPGVTAPVVSSLRSSPYGTFYIGAGVADGIKKGAHVLSTDGFAIGIVVETEAHQSLVKQIFAPGENIDAIIGDIALSLHGSGGGNASGDAPRSARIDTGAVIFSPADKAHAVGIVGKTEGGATSASVKVYARSPVNFQTLTYVYVEN